MKSNTKVKLFRFDRLALLISLTVGGNALAQQQALEQAEDDKVERIEVTGSRIKRTELEGVVNITTITSDDMIRSGYGSVYDALSNLSAANGAILGEVETGSYTPGAKELNLRGLGPEYTLILVNGKRLAYYPIPFGGQTNFVNLDMIPTAMVERIDIQTGGASAVYGSDAMAGVVNIITKRGIEGHHIEGKFGVDTYGTNKQRGLSLVGGYQQDKFSLDYALEYKNNDGLFSGDRPYHDSVWDNPSDTATRELNRSITVYSRDTETLNNYTEQYCNTANNPHSIAIQHYISRNNYGQSCGWDETGQAHLINKNETASVYFNMQYDLSDNATFFANGYFIDQEKKGNRGSLFFYDKAFWDPDLANKEGTQGAEVSYMWRKVLDSEYTDDGFGRKYDDSAYSFSLGVEGNIADFNYSVGYTRSFYDFNDQYLQATVVGQNRLLGPEFGTHNGLPIHRPDYAMWFGGLNNADALALADWVTYNGESYNDTFTADISGELYELDAGPIAFSFLVEVMREGTKAIPDKRVLNKEFLGLTGVTTDGERDRYAAAFELLVPIHEDLDIEAATRYDYYDDASNVGGALSSQLGFTYTPFESLVIRGAAGTTFRGPDMSAVYKGFSGNFGSGNDRVLADACLALANNGAVEGYDSAALTQTCVDADITSNPEQPSLNVNYESESVGDPTLKEETGDTFTTGFVYELNELFSFNLDYYQITVKDKVALLDAGYILQLNYECSTGVQNSDSALCQNMASRIERYDEEGKGIDRLGNEISGQPYTPHSITEGYINAAERRQSGIDVGFKGSWDSDYGQISYKVDLTRALSKKIKLRKEDELVEYINRQDNFDFKVIANAQVTWQKDDLSISLLANRKGEMWNNAPYGQRKKLPAWTRYNLTMAKQIDDLRLLFSVTNLFNAMPPQDETFSSYPFYRSGAYDTLGRQFTFQARYSF